MTKQIILAIVLIICVVIIFFVGMGVGSFYRNQQIMQSDSPGGVLTRWQNLVSSKTISSSNIVVVGKITQISGQKITISSGGDSLTVPIKQGANIYTLDNSEAGASNNGQNSITYNHISLGDIKAGESASITITINPNGDFYGVLVAVSSHDFSK